MAKSKVKPWLPDDRSHDERHADYVKRDINSVEQRLMAAWDDILDAVRWHQGNVVDVQLKRDAEKESDALAAGWIKDIGERIGALPTMLPTPEGALSKEELLNAAYDRVSAAHNDKQKVAEECAALRQESQRRIAVPLLKLVNEFNQEISHLAASDAVKAGYLRNVVSDLDKLVESDIATAIKLQGGVTNGTEPYSTAHKANTPNPKANSLAARTPKPPRRRRDDLSPVIDSAREKARNRSDKAEVWTILVEIASTSKPPVPLIAFKDSEIEHGDRANPSYLSKDAFGSRFRRLLKREARSE